MLEKPNNLDEDKSRIWDEVIGSIDPDKINNIAMLCLCEAVWRYRDALSRVRAEGAIVEDAKGNPIPHPAGSVIKDTQKEIAYWLKTYGRDDTLFE